MKAFRSKENSDAEPLLAAAKKASSMAYSSSSSNSNSGDELAKTPQKLKALAQLSSSTSPLLPSPTSVASMAMVRTSTCSTVHTSQDNTPNPSPREQTRKELPLLMAQMRQHGHSPPSVSLSGRKKEDALHYRNHDHIISPTTIALKKRCATLPASYSSPALWNSAFETDEPSGHGASKEARDDDLQTIKQTRSEGMTSSQSLQAKPYDCNYRNSLESAYENFGVERKLVALKQPQLSQSSKWQVPRDRAGTDPGTSLSPLPKAKSKPSSTRKMNMAHKTSITNTCGPIDIDEMDEKLTAQRALAMARPSRKPSAKTSKSTMTHHSAPTNTKVWRVTDLERLDTERFLSQMGMDVSEEDYCIEGEFSRRSSHGEFSRRSSHSQPTKSRCYSYDCDYANRSIEGAYENFGVERQLMELKQSSEKMDARDRKKQAGGGALKQTVMDRFGRLESNVSSLDDGRDRDSNRVHRNGKSLQQKRNSNNKTLKTKLLSILRGSSSGNGKTKDKVPKQIVATTISPTASEDHADCPITPEDMRLLYRWQTARVRRGGIIDAPTDEGVEAQIATAPVTKRASLKKKNYEDVLSITSSCGDKTALVDNRRERRHKQGCSF